MDLVSAIVGLDQARTMSSVQIAVAKKMLDVDRSRGNAAVQLIQSADQEVTSSGDALLAAATGLGGSLDTYA
jgi:hypothetical protein